MENPQKPNHSNKENCNNKRKKSSSSEENDTMAKNCNKKKTSPPEKKDFNANLGLDLNLRLSLSYYDAETPEQQQSQSQPQPQVILPPITPPLSPNHLPEPIQPLTTQAFFHSEPIQPPPPLRPLDQPIPFNNPPPAPVQPPAPPSDGSDNKNITIPPPFPWATDRPARVHTAKYLFDNKIVSITGEVQCTSCERKFEMKFDLGQKLGEVTRFMRKKNMHDRAPPEWNHPVLPNCSKCPAEKCLKPVIGDEREHSINWLFLFLGQSLGLCTLEQLRYFCMHTMYHRSGAKDRVLYLTYRQILKQLVPDLIF